MCQKSYWLNVHVYKQHKDVITDYENNNDVWVTHAPLELFLKYFKQLYPMVPHGGLIQLPLVWYIRQLHHGYYIMNTLLIKVEEWWI